MKKKLFFSFVLVCVCALLGSFFVFAEESSVSLTEMQWSRCVDEAASGEPWINKNYQQNPLVVAGTQYDVGFGVHPRKDAPAELEFELEGLGYNKFTATIGKDKITDVGTIRLVEFKVIVDGVEKYTSDTMTYGVKEDISVDITGAKSLVLMVTDGGDGYNDDFSVWANPTLVKTGEVPATTEEPTPTPTPTEQPTGTPAATTAAATASATKSASGNGEDDNDNNTMLIIIISAVVGAGAIAAAVVVVLKSKKK